MSIDDTGKEIKENLRYTLERLYKCRDLEISNLWQRSVFLSVFLILCFSAYGYLMSEMVKVNDYIIYENMSVNSKISNLIGSLKIKESTQYALQNYNLVAICISCVSIIFSILWIGMAKGSKAWYEVYENAIVKFEKDYYPELGIKYDYIMGNMGLQNANKDDYLFSTKAGGYSPSKINIAIGQVSLISWIIICSFHISCLLQILYHCCCQIVFFVFCFITILILLLRSVECCSKLDCIKSNFFKALP